MIFGCSWRGRKERTPTHVVSNKLFFFSAPIMFVFSVVLVGPAHPCCLKAANECSPLELLTTHASAEPQEIKDTTTKFRGLSQCRKTAAGRNVGWWGWNKAKDDKKEEIEDKVSGKDWKDSKGNNFIDSWSLIKLDRDIMKLKKSKFNQIPQQTIATSCFKFHREVDDNKWAFPRCLKEACSLCSL